MIEPQIETSPTADGGLLVRLSGRWTLAAIGSGIDRLRADLARCVPKARVWDLAGVSALDSAAAILLWRAWGGKLPPGVTGFEIFARIEAVLAEPEPGAPRAMPGGALVALGARSLAFAGHLRDVVVLVGRLAFDFLDVLRHPTHAPVKEFSATIYKAGAKALSISALLGFLIGVVLAYLSALQLRAFGAEMFVVNILGLAVVRELGPVLVAVLVAGRSGSAMTAQLGVMRVTEEIDALASMGVSVTQRLVLPRVLALSLVMPLLVLWTTAAALLGGMVAAQSQLDMSYMYFLESLPRVVRLANFYIGLGKGVVFGLSIALLACHFGLRVKPNTESLSAYTTRSVVVAISVVILIDAICALAMRSVGMPG